MVVAASGLAAPYVLAEVMALTSTFIWSPAHKYFWFTYGIALGKLPVDTAAVLDAIVSALLALAIVIGIARVSRNHPVSNSIIFVVLFLLSASVPSVLNGEYDLLMFFLTRPFVPVFLGFAAFGFWLASRSRGSEHVA